MVPEVGVEPTWSCPRWILSPVRLPVSPLRRKSGIYNTTGFIVKDDSLLVPEKFEDSLTHDAVTKDIISLVDGPLQLVKYICCLVFLAEFQDIIQTICSCQQSLGFLWSKPLLKFLQIFCMPHLPFCGDSVSMEFWYQSSRYG